MELKNLKTYPNFLQSLLLILSSFILPIFSFVIIRKITGYNLLPLVNVLFFLFCYFFISKKYKNPLKSFFTFTTINYKVIVFSLLVMLGFIIFLTGFNLIFHVPDLVVFKYFSDKLQNKFGPLILLVEVAVFAPIFEEIIHRGFILRGFIGNYSQKKAIFYSALLFSLFHVNPAQLLPGFLIGLFFTWLFIRLNSLFYSIIIHSIYNGILTSIGIIYFKKMGFIENIPVIGHSLFFYREIIMMLIGLVTAYSGIKLLIRIFSINYSSKLFLSEEEYEELKKRLFENNLKPEDSAAEN
jgi:membrane protease YdiL (CAAX protease family)